MAIGTTAPKAVSGIKRTRTAKALTSKVVGIKITELIEKLPTQEERDHALKVFHALVAPVAKPAEAVGYGT
jgi:hypothetical protein